MNLTLKEATTKRFDYETADQLNTHWQIFYRLTT